MSYRGIRRYRTIVSEERVPCNPSRHSQRCSCGPNWGERGGGLSSVFGNASNAAGAPSTFPPAGWATHSLGEVIVLLVQDWREPRLRQHEEDHHDSRTPRVPDFDPAWKSAFFPPSHRARIASEKKKFVQNSFKIRIDSQALCRSPAAAGGTEEEHGGLPERGGSLAKGSRDIRHPPLDGNPLAARAAGPEGGPHDDEERGVSERVSLRFTRGSALPYERGPAQSPAGHLVLTPPPLALSQVLGGKPVSGPGASGDRGMSFGLFLECSSSTSTSLTLPLPRANASRASSERSGAL